MPICKVCGVEFDGAYRDRYCGDVCRLMGRVEKSNSGCWEWTGSKQASGYGVINIKGVLISAHRLSYRLFVGSIDDGLFICHRCDNPKCVNPDHLFSGTAADNSADMAEKGRAAWKHKQMPDEIRKKISATRIKNGWKPSQSQIAASIAARAKKLEDPEWREMVYSKMRGEKNPNFGKKMSQEQREKLKTHWEKGGPMKGKKHTESTKQKMREAALARVKKST